MADSYTILQVVDIKILQGGNLLVPGREYSLESKPSGIYFGFRRTLTLVQQGVVPSVAEQLAQRYEGVLSDQYVTDIQYIKTTTPAGQPSDVARVYWVNDPDAPTAFGSIDVPQASISLTYVKPLVQAAIDAANAVLAT